MANITDLPPEVLGKIFESIPYKGDLLITENSSKDFKTDADKTDNIDFGASSSLVLHCRPGKVVTCWLVNIKKYLRDTATTVEVNVEDLDFGNLIRFIMAMRTKGTLARFAYNYYSRGSSTQGIFVKHTITSRLEINSTCLNTFLDLTAKIKEEDGYDLAIIHEVVGVESYQALNNFVAHRAHNSLYDHEVQHAHLFRALKKHLENVLDGDDEVEQGDVEMMDVEEDADGVEIPIEEAEMTGLEDEAGGEIAEEIELDADGFPAPV
ncbi:hypothetical protein CLAFUW4_03711 [Fulvia fulva]|uniref:uncharacterized protein n=1 Tax=Passalora fulva TaxID=5499 RepID=UPI0004EA0A51|nr:uncharacterized protein CLAFUR5_20163 [Fulvia fulva]KAK4631768.1 hypothetical protein CLAFUR4_03699 [Fulvia fulva]KAK4633000.1 hypothetical protein CLAFUR0_03702 [Fulvia fulva]WMI38803.1 hypothetical protein CLAFUR5_20163 [Fulvia fulva]WPV11676.1 hypothetical protein CLAFUW4_03711 [Fulvia fulva]WPV25483.1 hypothetical protein CLAFUW7_03703 [Fulvia fulva]